MKSSVRLEIRRKEDSDRNRYPKNPCATDELVRWEAEAGQRKT